MLLNKPILSIIQVPYIIIILKKLIAAVFLARFFLEYLKGINLTQKNRVVPCITHNEHRGSVNMLDELWGCTS